MIDPKRPTPEELTRKNLIDPTLRACGWDFETQIIEEEPYEGVEVIGGKQVKIGKSGRVDYLLCLNRDGIKVPVAILEAKKEEEFSSLWLEQAKRYAERFNVPFAFATNGHLVSSYDYRERSTVFDFPIAKFPSPAELQAAYEERRGFKLADKAAQPLFEPYATSTSQPRYYQDAAIRAALEKMASNRPDRNRVLLTLATGAGKTTLAVQLIHRLVKTGNAKKVLFLCDRSTLASQAFGDFSKVFGADVAVVGKNKSFKNARILVTTYQSLKLEGEDVDEGFFASHFPSGYFSHIVIDECHRSAYGRWFEPMRANPDAVHIGLTATPKQIEIGDEDPEALEDRKILADNFRYFGEPVYEYSIGQGQRDGYLAQCEITTVALNIDQEIYSRDEILALNPVHAKTGKPVEAAELKDWYEAKHLDKILIIPKRTKEFAKSFMEYLEKTGGYHQKTIVFCASDLHADHVAAELNDLYRKRQEPSSQVRHFAFKFTSKTFLEQGEDKETQETLKADFEGKTGDYMVATTVDLLSTGVDIKPLRNIVFFRHIASPILFYQMVGRWTRLHPESGKYLFKIYDYVNATRLFGKDFIAKYAAPAEPGGETGGGWRKSTPPVRVEDGTLSTPGGYKEGTRYVLVDERKVPVEEYVDQLVASILENVHDLAVLREIWIDPERRKELVRSLYGGLGSIEKMVELLALENAEECELYDILKEIAFKGRRATRKERALRCMERFEAATPPGEAARRVYGALVRQFETGGIEALETRKLFEVPELKQNGGIEALKTIGNPVDVLKRVKECILRD